MTYQQELIKYYERKGYLVLKNIRLNKSGFPDLQCLKNGVTIWIEVKEENDRLSELQKLRIKQLRRNGFDAFCIQRNKGKIY